jgi:hypothetical protein
MCWDPFSQTNTAVKQSGCADVAILGVRKVKRPIKANTNANFFIITSIKFKFKFL